MFLILYMQPLASEISSQLFSDSEMKFIYKKLNESLIWCKVSSHKCSSLLNMAHSLSQSGHSLISLSPGMCCAEHGIGLISAALLQGRSAGLFPEQRLVIKPKHSMLFGLDILKMV